MNSLTSSAKIDRRFARRFPGRTLWLRPASPEERRLCAEQIGSHGPIGFSLCIAVAHRDNDFYMLPFWSNSSDVSDATEGAAAMVVAAAANALQAGEVAAICPTRSGR